MDINDREGDAAAGVVTLPVTAGPDATLAVCQALMAAAAAVGLRAAAAGAGLSWLAAAVPGLVLAARLLGGGVVLAAVGAAMLGADRARRARFDRGLLSTAVDRAMRCTAAGLLAIAALA